MEDTLLRQSQRALAAAERNRGLTVTPVPFWLVKVISAEQWSQSQKNSIFLVGFLKFWSGFGAGLVTSQRKSFPSRKYKKGAEHFGLAHLDNMLTDQDKIDFIVWIVACWSCAKSRNEGHQNFL